MMQRVRLLLLLLCVQWPVAAQLISVQATLDADSMEIGDILGFDLMVESDPDLVVEWPGFKDTISSRLEILSAMPVDTSVGGGRRVIFQHFELTSFEPGMCMLPAIEVVYFLNGVPDTARSMPLMLHVSDPPVDTTKAIMPIKPPLNTPVSFKELLPWLLFGTAALILAVLLYVFIGRYLRRKSDPEEQKTKKQEPAHVVAFRELDRLKEEKLCENGQVKLFYTRLTGITRQYMERQYGFPAMELTTEEIMEAFRRSNPEEELLDDMLKDLLQLADLVKFAKEDPSPVDNQTNLNSAYIFVQKTFPMFFTADPKGKEATHA